MERGVEEECHDQLATTTFADDGVVIKASYDTRVEKDDISTRLESISDFLAKPKLIGSYTWSTADLKNSNITSFDIGATLKLDPYWMNKMQGFSLMRGLACVRVAMTANPFQQGRLLGHFLPNLSNFTGIDDSYAAQHNACIATKRQQPCVEVDCRDAVGVMEIPYIAPSNWFNLNINAYDWGRFYLDVLSPLATGAAGETTVQVLIYMYFCDVELAAPLVPQMGGGGPKKKFKTKTISRKDISTEELEAMEMKPLSSALRKGAVAASILGEVPILSAIAKPASWALDVAAGVASFLGWSKPLNNVQPSIVSRQFNRYLATSEGVNNSYPLGLRSDNAITITDGISPTDEDEMSMTYLKSISTCTENIAWTTAQLSGTSIYSKAITPQELFEAGTTSKGGKTVNWRAGPPIFYLSKDFGLWRGGIEVTIKVIKTDFHIGRLQLTWSPGSFIPIAPTTTTSMLSLREIVDVREGSEFTFTLPFMLDVDYIPTRDYSGQFDIQVLNELRCPESASGSVDILVYYRAAPDFEFQVPGWNGVSNPVQSIPFSPQMGDMEIIKEGIGNEPIKESITTHYSEHVNGEIICSVKQLLARASMVSLRSSLPVAVSNSGIRVWPWLSGTSYLNALGVLEGPNAGGDIYSKIAPMFAYFRGSMDVTVKTATKDTVETGRLAPIVAQVIPQDPTNGTYPAVAPAQYLLGFQSPHDWLHPVQSISGFQGNVISDAGTGFTSFRVPYYGRTKCSLNMKQSVYSNVPPEKSQPWSSVNMVADQSFSSYCLLRSCADDFQFAYFIGCPPLYYSLT